MNDETRMGLFRSLLLARVFEEKKIELAEEIVKTDISPTSCFGQEAIPVGFCYGLNEEDWVVPSIRSVCPAYIVKGLPLETIAAEMYGRETGVSKGRELSTHITHLPLGIIGGTGILAATMTVASGLALAMKYKKTRYVAVCFIGDGASNREEFFTGINLAALYKLPAIFVVENNQIAEYTCYEKFMPIKNIADRAAAFGIPGKIVDGNDVMAVYEVAQEAIERARDGLGPSLIECKTCRIRRMQETRGPEHCLPEEIVEQWKRRDPVKIMKERLAGAGITTEESFNDLEKGFQAQVDRAFDLARASRYAPPEDVFKDVYAEGGDAR